jgi:glucose/arabinose dehydrogenase
MLVAVAPAHALPDGNAFEAAGLTRGAQQLVQAQAAAPPGITESVVWSGLNAPTAISFAPDGRVFVAEKAGRIKVFDSLADPTPTIWADFNVAVHDYWDRGFLGMALDPGFTTGRPYVYALYPYNKAPNSSTVPRWPDGCPTPPGGTDDGCVVTGRLSRFTSNGAETVLIEDFCQQYPSHSVGSLAFGADGALYVSSGDGASFNWADYGQDGNPVNPCGDPPAGAGGAMTPPTAEGGALRSQDVRTTSDPTSLDGAILRVNPDNGQALPDNPNAGSSDPNARRIIAYGLRNPFRLTIRPGTNEVWSGDVGWNNWEEINRVVTPTGPMRNFGWPCYEGNGRQPGYDNLNLNLCETLYAQGAAAHATPYYTYDHGVRPVPGESCPIGSSSISGLAFYPAGGSFGPAYENALFFSDYSRNCIWVMLAGSNGLPNPATIQTFQAGAAGPVQLTVGPGGDLYYVDMGGGTIRRFRGSFSNAVPSAVATATPSSGAVPFTVSFDGRGSSDPNPGDTLSYAWDLDGDGQFDDSTSATPSRTYTTPGPVTVRLRVTDQGGLSDIDTLTVTAGTLPTVSITSPATGTTWRTGDTIAFAGEATDFQGNPITGTSLAWRINLRHCSRLNPDNCHTHVVQSLTGAGGSFVAPDHEYPSHLELELTATDSFGLARTVTRRLDPLTVPITLESNPPGAPLTLGTETATAPFTLDVIQRSRLAITAPASATIGGIPHLFAGWSDGGDATHEIVPGSSPATYTATFSRSTTPSLIAGTDTVGLTGSEATVGRGEVYRTSATADGRVTSIRIRLASNSTASALVLGVYADSGGQPTTLLASGRLNTPQANAWNEVTITDGPTLTAGTPYWIGLLNPTGSTGVLRWHDRAGATGGAEQGSASGSLAALPATWVTGPIWTDGPLSAYVMGVPPGPPPPPALAVSPASLSFSGVAGSTNPATKSLSVTNAGGGTLSFAASDDASWLSVSPGTGAAPRDLTVSVDIAGLAAGTHTATVRVESAGIAGSPKLIPVTLTLTAPQPPALSVSPAALTFTATEGGAAPPAQSLAVANTGGGTVNFTTSDDAAWLAASPGSGTAPASVSVSVNPAGLTRGTYSGSVRIDAPGATGAPRTVPVSLTVNPPATGLVGAWSFDETAGTTASDASGNGNTGAISGATRGTGRYGGALSFDGVNDWVTVNDTNALDLTTGMTLEAWVRPANVSYWRTVVIKEQPSQLVYALYASTDNGRPSGHVYTTGDIALLGPAALPVNTWSHLAMTWDGLTTRIYVNGSQVASSALTGTAVTSTSPLRIGGNAVWAEWFNGLIDEVRVYNRALTASQIASDRDTPIGGGGALLSTRQVTANRKRVASRRLTRDGRRRVHRVKRWLKNADRRAPARRRPANQAVGRH